nr:MAG TPA: hypothetical protein [Bacteriophage sp.]
MVKFNKARVCLDTRHGQIWPCFLKKQNTSYKLMSCFV